MLRLEKLCYELTCLFIYLTKDEAESTILVSFFFLCGICTSITFLSLMICCFYKKTFFIIFKRTRFRSSQNNCKLNGGKAYALASFGGGAACAFGGAVSLWFSFFNNKTNQIIGYQTRTYSGNKMNTAFHTVKCSS